MRTYFDTKLSMSSFTPSATEEGAEGPKNGPKGPPQELEGWACSTQIFQLNLYYRPILIPQLDSYFVNPLVPTILQKCYKVDLITIDQYHLKDIKTIFLDFSSIQKQGIFICTRMNIQDSRVASGLHYTQQSSVIITAHLPDTG